VILTQAAIDKLLMAQEDVRDAVRETDDLIVCAELGDVIAWIDKVLDWEEGTK